MTEEVWQEYSPVVIQFIADLEAQTEAKQQQDDDSDGEGSRGFGGFGGGYVEPIQLDLSNTKVNPYTLWKMLERLGYKKVDFQSNGWEFDFWIYFKKDGCKPLLVWGTGITFNLWLTKSDQK